MTPLLFSMPGGSEWILILAALFIIGLLIVPFIFFLLFLQRTLEIVQPENRTITPGQVWLVLIPLFGLVWQFLMVMRIAESLHAEMKSKNIASVPEKPGIELGLAFCILNCISPFFGFTSLGSIICIALYWNQINGFKKQLIAATNPTY